MEKKKMLFFKVNPLVLELIRRITESSNALNLSQSHCCSDTKRNSRLLIIGELDERENKRERATFLTITLESQQRMRKKQLKRYNLFKHIPKHFIPLSLKVCMKLKNSNRKHFVRQEGLQSQFQQNTAANTF